MTSRERVIRTLEHLPVDRAPRSPWALPGVRVNRKDEYDALLREFESDMDDPGVGYPIGKRCAGNPNTTDGYTDAWGCTWDVKQNGIIGEIKHALFENDYEGLESYEAPWELLDGMEAKKGEIALNCARTDKFVLAGTETRPFERAQFLRGTEDLFCDIATDEPKFHVLLEKLHAFMKAEMKFWASTAVDGVMFMDDWGTQRALLISPKKWRELFKPLYKDYCDILHAAGKYVFFHSDGFIEDIYPDLIEIGIDAVNSQLFCMDMESLGKKYAGKITFYGEVDRQRLLPFGTEEDVRQGVRRQYKALCPDGIVTGVFAQCEWGLNDPMTNVRAVYDEWTKIGSGQ